MSDSRREGLGLPDPTEPAERNREFLIKLARLPSPRDSTRTATLAISADEEAARVEAARKAEEENRLRQRQEVLDQARAAIRNGDLAGASKLRDDALRLGADVREIDAELHTARKPERDAQLARFVAAVKKDRLDDALEEGRAAVRLGADGAELQAAIEKMPSWKRRRAEEDRKRRESEGCVPLLGTIVQRIDGSLFEVTIDSSFPYPRPHSLLRTTKTTFTSAGRFFVAARPTGTKKVALTNGFKAEWEVWTECPDIDRRY